MSVTCAWSCLVYSSFLWAPPSGTDFPNEVCSTSANSLCTKMSSVNVSCFGGIVSICQKRKPLHRRMSRHCGTWVWGLAGDSHRIRLGFRGTRGGLAGDSQGTRARFGGLAPKSGVQNPRFRGTRARPLWAFIILKRVSGLHMCNFGSQWWTWAGRRVCEWVVKGLKIYGGFCGLTLLAFPELSGGVCTYNSNPTLVRSCFRAEILCSLNSSHTWPGRV